MRHLRTGELLDLAEGRESEASRGHLAECDSCKRQLAELTGALSFAHEFQVPEPSPLFWDHLAERVRARIEETEESSWLQRWLSTEYPRAASAWNTIRLPLAAAAIVAIGIFGLKLRNEQAPRPVTVTVASTPSGQAAAVADVPTQADDPSLTLLAALASDFDWDDAAAAGLTTDGGLDRAIGDLTPDERRELQLLITQELRSGA